jgi:prepilin-type N-terminal cleavage/methylation domain-containing protein
MKNFLKNNRGFSFVELLVVMGILAVVLLALNGLFMGAIKFQKGQDIDVEMQQNARSAADFMVRELRNKSDLSCLENTGTACGTAGDKVSFTSVTDANTRIFSWSSSDNILRFSKAAAGSPDRQPLADNITAVTLSPLDQNGNSTTTLTNVYRIDIAITARSSTIDPNTGNYRTFTFTTSVMKRN